MSTKTVSYESNRPLINYLLRLSPKSKTAKKSWRPEVSSGEKLTMISSWRKSANTKENFERPSSSISESSYRSPWTCSKIRFEFTRSRRTATKWARNRFGRKEKSRQRGEMTCWLRTTPTRIRWISSSRSNKPWIRTIGSVSFRSNWTTWGRQNRKDSFKRRSKGSASLKIWLRINGYTCWTSSPWAGSF